MTFPIRNISPHDLEVPSLGTTIERDAVAQIPDDDDTIRSFVCQPDTWEAMAPWTDPLDEPEDTGAPAVANPTFDPTPNVPVDDVAEDEE
jgi:hypothetical protein